MSKHKYRRSAGTSASSYTRSGRKGNRPGSSILVATEGGNTEPIYFESIRRMFSSPTVELVTHGAGRGDPRSLADAAIEVRNERRRQARKKELSINQLEDFDEIWIVFDTDVLNAEKRSDGIAYARSKGIQIAYSEPCFEYWLLLHGRYTTAQMLQCEEVQAFLKQTFGWSGYNKNHRECVKLIEPLVTKSTVQKAMKHAGRCRRHHEEAGTPFPANPSTDVDRLIEAINDASPRANKLPEPCPRLGRKR